MTRHALSRSHSAPRRPEHPRPLPRAGSACVGKCNRDYRKALAADPANVRPPRPGQPVWCVDEWATNPNGELHRTHTGCTTLIADDLARLPVLLARLPASGPLTTPRDHDTDEPHSPSPDPPSPSPAYDEHDDVTRWLYRLEDTTRARLRHTPAALPRRAEVATAYLGAWITALLADEDTAHQTGRDIQATARRLARLTGSDTLTLHIPGPCPNTRCGRTGRRYRRDGSDLIVCGACGLTETMDAHEERAARLLTELRRRGLRDQDQDQESATRCLATDRAGNPCGRNAIRGATMCPTHQLLTELRGEQART